MTNILAIDSDTRTAGVAYMEHGVLQECMILENPDPNMILLRDPALDWLPDYIVVEVPEVTLAWSRRGVNANNLVTLARAAGITATLFSHWLCCDKVKFVLPKEWKGQADKRSNQSRMASKHDFVFQINQKSITIGESPVPATRFPSGDAVRKSDWSHIMDAVGIADWATTKMAKLEYIDKFK